MTISLSDFNNLNEKEKKKTLQELKSEIGVSGLVEAWSVSRAKIYSMLHELNVPVNPRKPRKSGLNPPDVSVEGNDIRSKTKNKNDRSRSSSEKRRHNEAEAVNAAEFTQVYDVISEDGSKFSLSLDTHGRASAISETVQMLLSAGNFENTKLHLNLRLEEM